MRIVCKLPKNTYGDLWKDRLEVYSITILEKDDKVSILFVNTGETKADGVTEGGVIEFPFDIARAISRGIEFVLDTKGKASFDVSEENAPEEKA